MPRRTPDPKLVASVLDLVRMGCSASEVQETLGVPRSTVTRWVRAAEASCGDDIAAAVAALGDDWTITDAAEIAGVPADAVRVWLRARVDRTLARRGLPPGAVRTWLQFSEVRA